jgi:hypothetical protein
MAVLTTETTVRELSLQIADVFRQTYLETVRSIKNAELPRAYAGPVCASVRAAAFPGLLLICSVGRPDKYRYVIGLSRCSRVLPGRKYR